MPELPEVETTRAGVAPLVQGAKVLEVIVRTPKLRWPIPENLAQQLQNCTIVTVDRRAKYLLFDAGKGWLIIHLGMSGSLRLVRHGTPLVAHEHVDFVLDNGYLLRYRDPRRFGAVLWWPGSVTQHPLLSKLGPEPLSTAFNEDAWQQAVAKQGRGVKLALMDQAVVVGVGNIYANEALFRAGILPSRAANSRQAAEVARLIAEVKQVLIEAIAAGGSTLRDYVGGDGNAGYFQQNYWVYGRGGEVCRRCGGLVELQRQGQRATYFCRACQH